MKKLYGADPYVQSAGVMHDADVDGFAIAVCEEIGVELSRHKVRDLTELERMGEALSGFDLIVAMTPQAQAIATDMTRLYDMTLEYWPIPDPSGTGETRATKLAAYREARDAITRAMTEKWGTP